MDSLHTHLARLDANTLPLERFCEHGGYPDAASWTVTHVGAWVARGDAHVATFGATFVETQGAACGGRPQTHHHLVDGEATQHANSTITVRLLERDPPDEF